MRVTIAGGGISGLTAAYDLQRQGHEVQIIERDTPGGLIQTYHVDGCLVEGGPDSFVAAKAAAKRLIQELGLESELIPSNDEQRVTYIVRDRKLVPMPSGLTLMVPRELDPVLASPLFSDETKRDLQQRWRQPVPPALSGDESIGAFTRRHFNSEWLDYLSEPLMAGVFGGDPEKLSAASILPKLVEWDRSYANLTEGLLAERAGRTTQGPLFWSLRPGMGLLPGTLLRHVGDRIRKGVVEEVQGPPWRVRIDGEWQDTDRLLMAGRAYESAALLQSIDPELANLLNSIPYSSCIILALGYERSALGHPLDGFGFLVPARERKHVAASTWVGTKFHHRVPPDRALIRCFFSGLEAKGILTASDEEITEAARDELRELMGITADPRFVRVFRWMRSMPQYTLGHQERARQIRERVAQLPGLQLLGNFYQGVGIPDSVQTARQNS